MCAGKRGGRRSEIKSDEEDTVAVNFSNFNLPALSFHIFIILVVIDREVRTWKYLSSHIFLTKDRQNSNFLIREDDNG